MPATATLAQLSDNLVYSAIAVYALAMLAYAGEAALRARQRMSRRALAPALAPALAWSRSDAGDGSGEGAAAGDTSRLAGRAAPLAHRLGRVAVSLTVLAVGLHAAGLAARGVAAGRAPWGNMYEFATAAALAAAGAYLFLLRRQPIRDLGVWVVSVVLLTLGLAVTVLYTPAGDLVPALNSYWLVVHVAAAIISGGVFTVGAGASVLYLLRLRAEKDAGSGGHRVGARSGYAPHLPTADAMDKIAHTAHLFAFPVWTFAVIAGAIWAENSWGRYWGWDPKETWAFITWVLYAAYLHAQATAGWRGRKAVWFALAGYLAFLFNFFGVNMWISGLHSYAGI